MSKIYAHRGSSGTHPENTMAAFIAAEKSGADGIEMDVRFTKDRKLVVIHDETVDRTTNGKGKVSSFTLCRLKKLSAGSKFSRKFKKERVPTFEDFLIWVSKTQLIINVELKYSADTYPEFESDVLDLLIKYDMLDRLIISSFNHAALRNIADAYPNVELAILYSNRIFEPWNYVKTLGGVALHPSKKATDKEIIEQAREHNVAVRVYTLNKARELTKYIEMGSMGVITDYPERAFKIRKKLQASK